jgi:hypothetical protein
MTEEAMKRIRHGQAPITTEAVDEVLGEVRAAIASLPAPAAGLVALREFNVGQIKKLREHQPPSPSAWHEEAAIAEFFRLPQDEINDIVAGRAPLTDAAVDALLVEASAVIDTSPSRPAALSSLHDFVTELLKKVVEHRGLAADVAKRLGAGQTRLGKTVRPPDPDERTAMKKALGL